MIRLAEGAIQLVGPQYVRVLVNTTIRRVSPKEPIYIHCEDGQVKLEIEIEIETRWATIYRTRKDQIYSYARSQEVFEWKS